MPKYEHPGTGVLLLGIVLNVRLLLGIVLNARVRLLLLLLLTLLLLLLEQTTPAGQGPLLELLVELLLELLLLVVVLSRVVCSLVVLALLVVRWSNFSPIPVGRSYAFRANATARIKNTVIMRRPSLRAIKTSPR